MRTKALILSAMISTAGILSSLAADGNVYSVNVVGYINLKLTNQYSLISCQLENGSGNYVTNLFAGVPANTVISKFNGVNYNSLTWLGSLWTPPANRGMQLLPGEGVFVKKATNVTEINVTFTGEVLQGDLVNSVVQGYDIYSAMVPQEGGIVTVHGFQPSNSDVVYKFTGVGYQPKTWLTALGRWQPAGEPILTVGEAFFLKASGAKNWTRTFYVNQ